MRTQFLTLLAATTLSLSAAACTQTNVSPATTTATSTASAEKSVAQGIFSGRSDHITTGTASLVKTATGYNIVLSGDFELDGAPDPVVAVGNNETYTVANKLGALKNRTGAQSYELPANITPANFSQVYIWCEKFSVPLGVATLGGTAEKSNYGS